MNSCVLMAEVISNPELRKTPDDVDVANMMVVIPGLRDEDPSSQLRVVGWRNVGVEMSQNYQPGDRVILEGRLAMNLIERNGYKEKKAELVASRIYPVGKAESTFNQGFNQASSPAPVQQTSVQQTPVPQPKSGFTPPYNPNPVPEYSAPANPTTTTEDFDDNALDEIPF